MIYVTHKVYILDMREFQEFNWVVIVKVTHLIGFVKYRSHIMVKCHLF